MKKLILRADGMFQEVDKQVAMIKAITYGRFKWRRKTLFGKLVEYIPGVKEFKGFEKAQKNYKVSFILDRLGDKSKSYVIKRLLMIDKANKERNK